MGWPSALSLLPISAELLQHRADRLVRKEARAADRQCAPIDGGLLLDLFGYGQGRPEDAGFKFCNNLNYRLAEVIKRYSDFKATLVFCTTRKDTSTAGSNAVWQDGNPGHLQRISSWSKARSSLRPPRTGHR